MQLDLGHHLTSLDLHGSGPRDKHLGGTSLVPEYGHNRPDVDVIARSFDSFLQFGELLYL